MKKVSLLILLLILSPAVIADKYFTIHGVSKHINTSLEFNEVHPGLGLTWGNKWYGTAGFFKNSLNRNSVYAGIGYSHPFIKIGPIKTTIGTTALAATGYNIPIALIMLVPTLTIGVEDARFLIGYVPKVTVWPAVLTMSFQIKFE